MHLPHLPFCRVCSTPHETAAHISSSHMSSPKSPHFSAGKKNVVYFHPTTSLAKQSETSGESFPKAVLQIQEISH